jgi:lipopolysaccharide/colanic/teichoic acid biosynthesis glycosyltransferase
MYLEYRLELHSNRNIALSGAHRASLESLVKRAMDVVVAITLLIALAPLFLVIAALIKLTSPGPVVFRQRRPGLHRRPFIMLKFRTMTVDAERHEASLRPLSDDVFFKMKDDPRVTLVGRVLRRWSLDELPQLINVLKGEMSLVGPRPVLLSDLEHFDEWKQFRRFNVRPGMTGLWQVSGRSNASDECRMRCDLEYVATWSLLLDLKLLLKTIPVVLKGDGAV